MIAVIDRVRYNTRTSVLLASNSFSDGSNHYQSGRLTELYRTQNGRYFIAHFTQWQGTHDSIEPVDQAEAEKLFAEPRMRQAGVEFEDAFPDAEVEDTDTPLGRPPLDPRGRRVPMNLMLSPDALERLAALAESADLSKSEIATRAILAFEPCP